MRMANILVEVVEVVEGGLSKDAVGLMTASVRKCF